jgi:hypothetical protein
MAGSIVVLLKSEEGRKLVRERCRARNLSISTLEQLIAAEVEQQGKLRKRGIREEFDEIFDEIETEGESEGE